MERTSRSDPVDAAGRVSGLRITYALFGGILAWMTHLIAQTGLNGWVCEIGHLWPMHAVTIATLAAASHALWVGWTISRSSTPSPDAQAARFLGLAAVVINIFNVVMIVAEWVPVVFIDPCSRG